MYIYVYHFLEHSKNIDCHGASYIYQLFGKGLLSLDLTNLFQNYVNILRYPLLAVK